MLDQTGLLLSLDHLCEGLVEGLSRFPEIRQLGPYRFSHSYTLCGKHGGLVKIVKQI